MGLGQGQIPNAGNGVEWDLVKARSPMPILGQRESCWQGQGLGIKVDIEANAAMAVTDCVPRPILSQMEPSQGQCWIPRPICPRGRYRTKGKTTDRCGSKFDEFVINGVEWDLGKARSPMPVMVSNGTWSRPDPRCRYWAKRINASWHRDWVPRSILSKMRPWQ